MSSDKGETWSTLASSKSSQLSERILVRSQSTKNAPSLHLPRCASQSGLIIAQVRLKRSQAPIGLRWVSAPGCERSNGQSSRTGHARITNEVAVVLEPHWLFGVVSAEDAMKHIEEMPEKSTFWGKYALYIMGIIAIALFQGIRRGLAELQEEVEREEAQKRAASARAAEGQVRVAVPRRKAKGKRRAATAARGASGEGRN